MPALLTRMSSLPNVSSGGRDGGGPVGLAGDVVVQVPAVLVAELVGDGLAEVVEHVAEDDLRAFGDEVPDVGLAHAAGAAGDQRHLAVKSAHACAPSETEPSEPNACLVRITGRRAIPGCGSPCSDVA